MFNKFFGGSLDKVLLKADEISKQVTQRAAKARDALGLRFQRQDASHLEHQLESQASQASTINQLHDLYVKWVAQLVLSDDQDSQCYFDTPQTSMFSIDLPSLVLGSSFQKQSSSINRFPGDLLSSSTWIVHRSPASPETPRSNTSDPPTSELRSASGTSRFPITDPPPHFQEKPAVSDNHLDDENPDSSESTTDFNHSLSNGLTFRQVFLRSQALEIALLSVARLRDIRTKLVGASDENNIEATTRGALERLMSLTMRGGTKAHTELLFLFCSVDLSSEAWEVNLRHLAELTALLKVDWLDDYYKCHIAKMNEEIYSLKETLKQMSAGTSRSTSSSSSLSQLPETDCSTENSNLHIDARASQLVNYCATSKKIVELLLKVDRTILLSTERCKAVEESVSRRLDLLRDSATRLVRRFANLQTKAVDRSAIAGHENQEAAEDLEKKLADAFASRELADTSVETLERQRRELFEQLETIELRLTEMMRAQRSAHDLVEKLLHNKDAIQKAYDREAAVAVMVKRESEILQLDMQNMKILIEHTKEAIQSREGERRSNLIGEKEHLLQEMKLNVLNHVKHEVEHLKIANVRLTADLNGLERACKSRSVEDERLKKLREEHLACQSEYKKILQEYNATAASEEESGDTSASPNSSSIKSPALLEELLEKGRELESLHEAHDVAKENQKNAYNEFSKAQERFLVSSCELDSIWNDLSRFLSVRFPCLRDECLIQAAPMALSQEYSKNFVCCVGRCKLCAD